MYIPSSFNMADTADLHAHIRAYSFATLVTHGQRGMVATHLPILLEPDRGAQGYLLGHMARANPQWKGIEGEALVIFSGPHAYISPTWYESPGTVPTWNYVTVHAYGALTLVDERDALHDILGRTVSVYEASLPRPWTYDSSDPGFDRMLNEIVGFQIEITRLEGKRKLNQNHPLERRQKVIQALQAQPDGDSQAIAAMMAATLPE